MQTSSIIQKFRSGLSHRLSPIYVPIWTSANIGNKLSWSVVWSQTCMARAAFTLAAWWSLSQPHSYFKQVPSPALWYATQSFGDSCMWSRPLLRCSGITHIKILWTLIHKDLESIPLYFILPSQVYSSWKDSFYWTWTQQIRTPFPSILQVPACTGFLFISCIASTGASLPHHSNCCKTVVLLDTKEIPDQIIY